MNQRSFVVLLCLYVSCRMDAQNRPFLPGLNLIVQNEVRFSSQTSYLTVLFFNNSMDTLLLPIEDYAFLREYFLVEFQPPHQEIWCGAIAKRNLTPRNYQCQDFNSLTILPFQFRTYRYSIGQCDSFEIGVTYQYQITLRLQFQDKIKCPNLWQGIIYSNIGSFTMTR
jgi:hypothetical protein